MFASKGKAFITFIGFSFVNIILATNLFPNASLRLKSWVYERITPITASLYRCSIRFHYAWNAFIACASPSDEIKVLQAQIAHLMWLQQENKILADAARLIALQPVPFCSVMLATAPSEENHTVVLRGDRLYAIHPKSPVIFPGGVVGRILEVYTKSATAMMLTHPHMRLPIVGEKSSVHAMVAGDGTSFPCVIHADRENSLIEGEMLMTSGAGGIFPPGLLVGLLVKDAKGTLRIIPAYYNTPLYIVQVMLSKDEEYPVNRKKEELKRQFDWNY